MVRDSHQRSEARSAHQAFQAINPVESRLVASVGQTTIRLSPPNDTPVLLMAVLWRTLKARAHPAAATIDDSK